MVDQFEFVYLDNISFKSLGHHVRSVVLQLSAQEQLAFFQGREMKVPPFQRLVSWLYKLSFIWNDSHACTPFHVLILSKIKVTWNEQDNPSLIYCLSFPVRGSLDPNRQFIVEVETSNSWVGAVLSNVVIISFLLLHYFFKNFFLTERNYVGDE